jgi:hypothetical protein
MLNNLTTCIDLLVEDIKNVKCIIHKKRIMKINIFDIYMYINLPANDANKLTLMKS